MRTDKKARLAAYAAKEYRRGLKHTKRNRPMFGVRFLFVVKRKPPAVLVVPKSFSFAQFPPQR
jgi:hypothetical protein